MSSEVKPKSAGRVRRSSNALDRRPEGRRQSHLRLIGHLLSKAWKAFAGLGLVLGVSYYLSQIFKPERLEVVGISIWGRTVDIRQRDANRPDKLPWTVRIRTSSPVVSHPTADVDQDGIADGIGDTDGDGIPEIVIGLGASGARAGQVVAYGIDGRYRWSFQMGRGNPYLFQNGPVQVTQVLLVRRSDDGAMVRATAMRPQSAFQQLVLLNPMAREKSVPELESSIWSPGNLTIIREVNIKDQISSGPDCIVAVCIGVNNDWPPFIKHELPYVGVCLAIREDFGQLPPWRGSATEECPQVEPLWMGYFPPDHGKIIQSEEFKLTTTDNREQIQIRLSNGKQVRLSLDGVPIGATSRRYFVPIRPEDVDYAKLHA